ncbi:MAG: hypothetical protein J6U60_00855 [Clostridia bacterium]|nr:hypothetical protein [Clostridia bacterium]
MKKKTNSRKNKLLALFLSLMMATSTLAAFASCTDGDSSSSSSSSDEEQTEETVNDEGIITNADFETFNNNKGLNPIVTSVTGWTRSVNSATSGTALSSKAASGIIDTQDEAWADLTVSKLDKAASTLTEDEAKAKWDTMTTRDKLEYYKAWKNANDDDDITDLDFYESFNIDDEDLPLIKQDDNTLKAVENPRTHDWVEGAEVTKDDDGKTNTKILMLHNEYSNSSYAHLGTAQKFTSSTSVTVNAGTSANFSVWVKTSDLTCTTTSGEQADEVVDKGAYISITHSVGGKSLDPLQIKNINTANVTDNNGWVKYEFALKGASYADSTFTIVLGLGLGGGTDRFEYVNGYAFFDDIKCTIVENDKALTGGAEFNLGATKEAKVIDAATNAEKKFTLDFSGDFENYNLLSQAGWEIAPTIEKRDNKVYTAVEQADITKFSAIAGAQTYAPTLGAGFDAEDDKYAIGNAATILNDADNKFAKAAYNEYIKDHEYLLGGDTLVLFSARGVAYTAKSPAIEIAAGEKVAYSFFVKTSDMNGVTGAGITLLDGEGKPAITNLDTTSLTPIKVTVTENNEETEKELHDGWQQCFFFIHNDGEDKATVQLSFTLGSTTVIDTEKTAYGEGLALFAGFKKKSSLDAQNPFSDEAFECAASGSYSKIVTLTGETNKETGDSGFDSATKLSEASIEDGFALPKNYKGVYADSAYVGGNVSNTTINSYKNAGLLNKEHADTDNYKAILKMLNGSTDATWDDVFGDSKLSATATQPLVIYNDASDAQAAQAYGYIGTTTTIGANETKTVSLRVKVSAGATASVYLIDTDDDTRTSALSLGRTLTYWYDEDGNVLAKDPDADDFVARTDTAFKLQANGLYKVNPNWSGAENIDKNAYFANLQAYGVKAGNLVLADGGVSYEYSDNWKHDGNDGVAFYDYDATAKTAYAYNTDRVAKENNLLVYDFSNAAVPARFEAISDNAQKSLQVQVSETGDSWATVTFYVCAGDTAKNYRLEVWSGARDNSKVNGRNAYVAFDAWTVSDVEDMTKWLNDTKEEAGVEYFESAFSFYDSAKYLRYDESLDENKVGNSYDNFASYSSASNAEKVAYLYKAVRGVSYTTYADFSTVETTINAEADEEDTTPEEDTTTQEGTTNVWLLASSIAIAAVLVLAVASLVVRKAIVKARKTRGARPAKSAKPKKDKKAKQDKNEK